jgi:hypothetical protein
MSSTSFDKIVKEIMSDKAVRCAAIENGIRRTIGRIVCKEMKRQDLDFDDMQDFVGPPTSQLRRLLHDELGGQLTLYTICRALDALELELKFEVVSKRKRNDQT